MRQNWTDGAAGWVENEAIFDSAFAPVTAAILAAAGIRPGRRVLDVGCGSGSLLAAAVAADADAVGIDISPGMAEAARRRVPTATVVVGDAQTAPLSASAPGPPFDVVVSRFGVMFFADPTAAFTNIRSAAAPGARLAFVCWRDASENPMFHLGVDTLTARLDDPPEAVAPDAPGPTAFADRDRLVGVLEDAGWTSVSVEPLDVGLDFGIGGSDGVEERLAVILASSRGRSARAQLEPVLGRDGWAALLDEVRAALRGHLVDGAVRFRGATWLVTATNQR